MARIVSYTRQDGKLLKIIQCKPQLTCGQYITLHFVAINVSLNLVSKKERNKTILWSANFKL